MKDRNPAPPLGPRLRAVRLERGLSLDDLAARSGVSRSMLSQVERGQANPTFATLWNLTNALGLEFSELIGLQSASRASGIEVAQASFTPEMKTEDGKCRLRILSPTSTAGAVEWYDLTIDPGGSLVSAPHAPGAREHLTVREGRLSISSGADVALVGPEETARYAADAPHAIRNEGDGVAKALLVVISRP
jgi:transcriptional regulator with XRE-family HTH domain